MVVEVEGLLRAEPGRPCPSPSNRAPGHKEEKSQEGSGSGSWWAGLNLSNELQH